MTQKAEQTSNYRYYPGEPNFDERVKQMIRVNHAGEYGAKRIYAGQIAVLGDTDIGDELRHMAEQEEEHLEYFSQEITKRRVRPTILSPLWHVGAFALGAGTALLGKRAAMACTVAVEEVIDEHYAHQLEELGKAEPELVKAIEKFREEELEHRDIGIEHEAELTPGYALLSGGIKKLSKMAIWLSTRV